MRLRLIAIALASFGVTACSGGVNTVPLTRAGLGGSVPPAALSAAYVDSSALGSLSHITASGWASPNVLLIGFADPTSAATSSNVAAALNTAAVNRSYTRSGNLTFLSIGGANTNPWTQTPATLAANMVSQINIYNTVLSGNNQVAGVDLDLENGFTPSMIAGIAQAMHGLLLSNGKKLLVSIAPQVVGVNGVNVDATQPTNLGFSPSGLNNNYGLALQNNSVDYVMAQTYNTGPTGIVLNNVASSSGTVQGVNESNVLFFQGIGQALSNVVRASCTNATTLCITSTTQIFIVEPANQGAGGTYTLFNPSAPQAPPVSYNQAAILTSLTGERTYMQTNTATYQYIAGVGMWALGNDYAPALYGDTYATPGAFSTAMFGASPAPAGPSILLQLTNNGSISSTITLISNGLYYPFPAVAGGANATWCTQAATGTYGCTDSSILDTIGAGTVTVQITPAVGTAWICPAGSGVGAGGTVTLTSGRYNLQVNGDFDSCAFGSF